MGNGTLIFLGIDPFVGMRDNFPLFVRLIRDLHERNMYDLKKVFFVKETYKPGWLYSVELNLNKELVGEWDLFVKNLAYVGIYLTEQENLLVWDKNKGSGVVITKLMYHFLADYFLSR